MRECFDRLYDAENTLREVNIPKQELAQEWESQVTHHTRTLPSKLDGTID